MNKIATLSAVFAFSAVFAQSFNTQKMNSFMQALDQNRKFMGTVAVAENGKTVYSNAFGYADVENKIKNTPETRFRIGSITKTFTSVLVMKAVEENKLKLDEKLSKYFPQIKNADKITLEHLLNHRSGIHNVTALPDYLTWNSKAITPKDMVAKITAAGSDFEPGNTMSYSNSNYILLSYILETAYQKTYAKLLEEKITKPLGLNNTYFGKAIDPANKEAYSYVFAENFVKDAETDMSVPTGAGAVVSTTGDLLKFANALFGGKVVSAASLEKMMKMTDSYGYGLFSVPFNGLTGYGHTGGIDGFTSALYHFPENKTTYVMLSNGSAFDNNRIAIAALSAATGKDFDIPTFKSVAVKTDDLNKLTGTYSSTQIPLKIDVRSRDGKLFAQATGQSEFALDAESATVFKFESAGIELHFNPSKNEMTLLQSGMKIPFTKDKK
ncbi:serine hydrolase [Kaistella sp. PBT33-4]|uniref:serine hydrolase domain-containing protein n=1 Tax=Kaistella sp. PBT33-4 TaxID=3032000 RepID=UPI0023D89FA8|nr:serine hydrolase domain-containing protein [Kaistella sp. PBT33-4]MDF0720443.1 serine hydrolase [Kaistella sp. PBT33-4]